MNKIYILDPWRRNPVLCNLVKKTDTGGTIGEDERGIRYYATADRVIDPNDLFAPDVARWL